MKTIYIVLFSLMVSVGALAQEALLERANSVYSEGNFQEAATLYQQAIDEFGQSADVYYNLGNCYFKMNRIASSILNYERALLLAPGNDDIRFNLEVARTKTVDRLEPVGEFFLSRWIRNLQNEWSTDSWSYFSIVCFLFVMAGAALFFFSRKVGLKKLGFYAAIVFLVFTITGNIFANIQKKELTNRNTAIIFSPTTTIKSSPDNSGTDLFILHEGTKVIVKSTLGSWSEIATEDGNVGWIPSQEIEII